MPNFPIHVWQDGGVFYVYRDTDRGNLLFTRQAPFPVRDSDVEAAKKARKWFIALCSVNQRITWGGAHDYVNA